MNFKIYLFVYRNMYSYYSSIENSTNFENLINFELFEIFVHEKSLWLNYATMPKIWMNEISKTS